MAILDTSVLVALVDASHRHHADARAAVARTTRWDVPAGVVFEFTRVIRRQADARGMDGSIVARRMLENIETAAPYRYLVEHDRRLTSRIYHANLGVSYEDAWGIAVAIERQEPLMTFDSRQQPVYGRLK